MIKYEACLLDAVKRDEGASPLSMALVEEEGALLDVHTVVRSDCEIALAVVSRVLGRVCISPHR